MQKLNFPKIKLHQQQKQQQKQQQNSQLLQKAKKEEILQENSYQRSKTNFILEYL